MNIFAKSIAIIMSIGIAPVCYADTSTTISPGNSTNTGVTSTTTTQPGSTESTTTINQPAGQNTQLQTTITQPAPDNNTNNEATTLNH